MEAFPQHGKHNFTEPSPLSRRHIPEASTVHQTKAVGHLDVNHSLRFLQYQTRWCCGRLDWSPRRKRSRCDRMKGWLALHMGSGLHPHLGMMSWCVRLHLQPHSLILQDRKQAKILDCHFVGSWFLFYLSIKKWISQQNPAVPHELHEVAFVSFIWKIKDPVLVKAVEQRKRRQFNS